MEQKAAKNTNISKDYGALENILRKVFINYKVRERSLILGDLICFAISILLTAALYKFRVDWTFNKSITLHFLSLSPLAIIWIPLFYLDGFYSLRTQSDARWVIRILFLMVFYVILSYAYFYLFAFQNVTPKTNLLINSAIFTGLVYFWRRFILELLSKDIFQSRILAIGEGALVNELKGFLNSHPNHGFSINRSISIGTAKDTNLLQEIQQNDIQFVVFDRKNFQDKELVKKYLDLLSNNIPVYDLAYISERFLTEIPLESIDDTWVISNMGSRESEMYKIINNLFDKIIGILILLLVSPIFLPLLAFLKIKGGGPVFFSQKRVGQFGKEFTLYKLRTMSVNAEKDGAKWATPNDNRVTPIGKFLRKTRLDEIPQIWNVLKGEMSIVGPRPERKEFIETVLKDIPFYCHRHLVKPGITGWAQVNYRYGFSVDDSIKKLRLDLFYVKNKSIRLDLVTILKTIKIVIRGGGQ